MDFKNLILNWYRENLRDLPWRKNKNPYSIWLSEIILQQTQVIQGLPYYEKLIFNFPTVKDLAGAEEEKVLKLWQGLGYYSRARNLHAAAKYIVDDLEGEFPKDYKSLLNLKGVGDYTASAIASIAYNEAVPTVDGNVIRVISRVFDIDLPVDTPKGKKAIKDLMAELMDKKSPGDFNQAVMELGAKVCKPKKLDCSNCPLLEKCLSFKEQNYLDRPVKSKKVKITDVYIDYLLLVHSKGIIMQKRDDKSIWKNLYELPNITSDKVFVNFEHLDNLRSQYTNEEPEILFHNEVKHKLSHRNLYIRFFRCNLQNIPKTNFVTLKNIERKPVPKPIETFLDNTIF